MNNESTPLFECPLHTLLGDFGFNDGDGGFTLDDPTEPHHVTIIAPTGYGFSIPLPDTGVENQLTAVMHVLDGFDPETEDTEEQARSEGYDDPQDWHDVLVATRAWCDMQIARIQSDKYGLIRLMRLDPHAMPTEGFLLDMWSAMNTKNGTILFTLLDEYLKSIDHPAMRRPQAASQ